MKQLWRFVRHYKLFAFAFASSFVALGLDLFGFDSYAHWLLIAVIVIELLPLLWGMLEDLREGKYGVDILAATAIITAVVMHEYWAGLVIVLMLTGGESLEDYAEHRAKRELTALLSRAPAQARVIRKGKEIEIKAAEVKIGDVLIIRPGEVVPADANIIEGEASFDEANLTGESLPQLRTRDDTILSGSVNVDGAITARAIHDAANSQYEQIIKLVRSAQKSQAPFVRMADRYAVPFTIMSLMIAGAAWALSGQSIRFLEVLVVATPCPLILAAPIAIISGMSRAAKHGIIIKTGSALERLATAKTFAFDKTGTLTSGKLTVATIKTYSSFSASEVLSASASIEQQSNHVLAQAIIAKAKADKVKLQKVKELKETAGNGLSARVGGKPVLVGRLSLLTENGVVLPAAFKVEALQATATFVAIGEKLAGVITFKDELRPEAKQTLQRLREDNVTNIIMVTGDNQSAAAHIAKKLGITKFFAGALPADKIRVVEKEATHPVAFVGDGVNDAPVLTASDVGIALGARGSTAASESADIVVMQDDLERVAESRHIAVHTLFIAQQSILVGIALSLLLMGIFATGKFRPIYGAAIQEVVDVVVIFNALRAHTSSFKHRKKWLTKAG